MAAVEYVKEGKIAYITINRPEAMNSLSVDVREDCRRPIKISGITTTSGWPLSPVPGTGPSAPGPISRDSARPPAMKPRPPG